MSDEELIGSSLEECIEDEKDRAVFKGAQKITEERKCIMQAEKFSDLEDCQS